MIYYLLPNSPPNTYEQLFVSKTQTEPNEVISHSLSFYLTDIKNRLNHIEKEWDKHKKYTNTYEYIHSNVPYKKKAISKYKPLSRSYFKMIEMIHNFNLLNTANHVPPNRSYFTKTNEEKVVSSSPIKTFHLAEGPGGFIEAFVNLRNNSNDVYYGMTLCDTTNDGTIPGGNKSDSFLANHKNVIIENGEERDGNILSLKNFAYCYKWYGSSMDLITADGGFDFSVEFNKQEVNMTKLLFAQLCYGVCLQKKGGCFILKIFDVFCQHTIDIVYLLSSLYQKVYMTKPLTSRIGNSEKYLVCKGFLLENTQPLFRTFYLTLAQTLECGEDEYISSFLAKTNASHKCETIVKHTVSSLPVSDITINHIQPAYFISKLEEYNSIFGQQQIENIHYTISLIYKNTKQDKIYNLIRNNINKCIHWCIKYNIPYNNISNNNIFLSRLSPPETEENKEKTEDENDEERRSNTHSSLQKTMVAIL